MAHTVTPAPRAPVSAEHLRGLVHRSPLPVLLLRIEPLRVVEASDSFVSFVGRDRPTLRATPADELTDQPNAAKRSIALVASGVIDGYTRHATFRMPSGEVKECDLRITACAEETRQHAVVSVLPPSWAAEDADALVVDQVDDTLTMGTVNGQWVVDRITTARDVDAAFESGQLLNRSVFVVLHPEDVGELMFVAAQASRQRSAAFGRIRLRSSAGGWHWRRVGLQPLGVAPSQGYAFILFSGSLLDAFGQTGDRTDDLEGVVETTIENIRASVVAGWMVTFPTALQMPELSTLTAREYEILLRLAAGERVRTIARSIHLSESTVRNHLTAIFRKVGVGSQTELLSLLRERAGERGS